MGSFQVNGENHTFSINYSTLVSGWKWQLNVDKGFSKYFNRSMIAKN